MTDIDIGYDAGTLLVLAGNDVAEPVHALGLDQVDGTSTEAATGHARTVHAVYPRGYLYHQVEFLATHFVIIPQAGMRLVHEFAEPGEVSGLERVGCRKHAIIFADDMPTPPI